MTVDDILRMRYRERQFLGARDFTDEQAYQIESRRRHNLGGHSWGIVSGLAVEKNASGIWVATAGSMVDAYGRETYLFEDEPLDTERIAAQLLGQAGASLKVWLSYRTEETSAATGGYAACSEETLNTRLRESFVFVYQDDPPPFDGQEPEDQTKWPVAHQDLPDDSVDSPWPVLLATIQWDGTTSTITSADATGRHYSGLRGVEVFTETGELDIHASRVRMGVSGSPAVLTTYKASGATLASNLHLSTNDDAGGNTVVVGKDDLEVTKDLRVSGKATVAKTVGNGSGKLYVEADTAQDLAMLTRPANAGSGAAHDLAIRTNDGAGGNHILMDVDDVTLQSLTVDGAATIKGSVEMWGGQLILKDAAGGDNTDAMILSRFDGPSNVSDLRVQIGDDLDGNDRFVVGPLYYNDLTFKEQFIVDNQGNVTAAGSVNGRSLATDGAKLDGISAGAKEVAINQGILHNGEIIPLPEDFDDEADCVWSISPYIAGGTAPFGVLLRQLEVEMPGRIVRVVFDGTLPPLAQVRYLIVGRR